MYCHKLLNLETCIYNKFHLSATSGMKLDRHYNIYSTTAVTTWIICWSRQSSFKVIACTGFTISLISFLMMKRIINHNILCIKYFHSYYTINKSVHIWGTFWRHFPMTNINQSTWCYVPSLVEFWGGSFKCIKCIPQTRNCIRGRSISCSFIHLYQSKGESYIIYGVFTDKFILTDYISYLPKIRFFYLSYFFYELSIKVNKLLITVL